jgi:hypothetical protein
MARLLIRGATPTLRHTSSWRDGPERGLFFKEISDDGNKKEKKNITTKRQESKEKKQQNSGAHRETIFCMQLAAGRWNDNISMHLKGINMEGIIGSSMGLCQEGTKHFNF